MPANSRIRYSSALIRVMSFFESATGAKLRDCFVGQNGLLVFVVEPAQYGLAVGRNGSKVKHIENALKRRVKVVEFSDDIPSFVDGIIRPLKANEVVFVDGVVTLKAGPESRGYLIGRGGSNLRQIEAVLKRYFPVSEVRVA